MQKIFAFLVACAIYLPSHAISTSTVHPVKPAPPKASEILIPVAPGKVISLQELADMKMSDFQQLRGKKMKFFDRLGFKLAQRKLRNSIAADGTVKSKKLQKLTRRDGATGFHLGGFALGFFVGLIGVLIAYLINDDYKSNRVKWAWIGFGIGVLLYILLIVAIFA